MISYSLCASARSWRAGSEKAGKNIKLAVIGTGWIVKSFIDGLKFAPDFELFAVYSRSRERGEKFAKENGISTVYTSLDALAASPAECVYIASPTALH